MIQDETIKKVLHESEKGLSAENPLECIGITAGVELSCKVYYIKNDRRSQKNAVLPESIQIFADNFCDMNVGAKLFDYSERAVSDCELQYSVGFLMPRECETETYLSALPRGNSHTSYYKDLSLEIRDIFRTAESNIIQIGFLLDKNGNILETKIYFSLNSTFRAPSARLNHFRENQSRLSAFFEKHSIGYADSLMPALNTCLDTGYHPFLLGINEAESNSERKVYFVVSGQSSHCEENAVQLYHALGLHRQMEEINRFMYGNDLYLRGMALSYPDNDPVWRFYFYPVKK